MIVDLNPITPQIVRNDGQHFMYCCLVLSTKPQLDRVSVLERQVTSTYTRRSLSNLASGF